MQQKLGIYIILLVIGALIGASTTAYVTLNKNKIETSELTVIDMVFSGSDSIKVRMINTGTEDVTINQVRINGSTISAANWTLDSGNSGIVRDSGDYVEITSAWTAGNKYAITFFAPDGTILGSFIDTA